MLANLIQVCVHLWAISLTIATAQLIKPLSKPFPREEAQVFFSLLAKTTGLDLMQKKLHLLILLQAVWCDLFCFKDEAGDTSAYKIFSLVDAAVKKCWSHSCQASFAAVECSFSSPSTHLSSSSASATWRTWPAPPPRPWWSGPPPPPSSLPTTSSAQNTRMQRFVRLGSAHTIVFNLAADQLIS